MDEISNLEEFNGSVLTGITVGAGSLLFRFSRALQVTVQCDFELISEGRVASGHGEVPASCPILFVCLNHEVVSSSFGLDSVLSLQFDDGNILRVIPERNCIESYVIFTSAGMFPIIVDA